MNWKAHLRVSDLEKDERLEATCRQCGHVHFITVAQVKLQRRDFLHIDELEAETICKARGCMGQCRLAKVRPGETSGFVGGLA